LVAALPEPPFDQGKIQREVAHTLQKLLGGDKSKGRVLLLCVCVATGKLLCEKRFSAAPFYSQWAFIMLISPNTFRRLQPLQSHQCL
jgi:hypothetical protein